MSATSSLPEEYALPPEPPVGTVVRGGRFHYIRRDFSHAIRWAAGPSASDCSQFPSWTWGEVLNDGPVRVVASGGSVIEAAPAGPSREAREAWAVTVEPERSRG